MVAFVVALFARRLRLPYALTLVVTGLVLGILRLFPHAHLQPSMLMTVFLPPLLFESALNLHIDLLKRDWMPIAAYTLAGTFASTMIIGAVAAGALHIPLPVGMLFGALISTTDPISVIAVFRRLGAGKRLTLILEAESLFNNDIAVVLYTVILGLTAGTATSYGAAGLLFLKLAAGGALLGTAIGMVASRLHYEIDDHLIEITLTTAVAFGSYWLAERLGVSGVMAVVAAGIVLGNHGMRNAMSASTQLAVSAFWEYLAFVVNSVVFLLIGIEAASIDWRHKIVAAVIAFFAVLAGRSAIYPISFAINRMGGNIPRSWQHVLVWGGLRGALSMALVLGLDSGYRYGEYRGLLIATTFGVVVCSLLIQGSTVGSLLRRLRLIGEGAGKSAKAAELEAQLTAVTGGLAEIARMKLAESEPEWHLQQLFDEYAARETRILAMLEVASPGYETEKIKSESLARASILKAEKSALIEAEKLGKLAHSDWRAIGEQIDEELLRLNRNPEV